MQTISLADVQKQFSVLQIAERFFDSITLFALFETGVFRVLSSGSKTHNEIQAEVNGNSDSLQATLDAAVALKILSRADGKYSASEAFLDCLGRKDSPAYVGEWVAFLRSLAAPLLELGDAIQTGSTPGATLEDFSDDNAPAQRMTAAMDAYARSRGIEIAEHIDFTGIGRLLDLGCGPGTYSMAIVEKFPEVKATLLDQPGAIAEARRIAESRGMTNHLEFVTADARTYLPDEPFDAVLISNMLHMMQPAASIQLLTRCFGMMSPGGRMIVQAQYLNDDRVSPRWATLLNLCQRVVTQEGRNHAIGETKEWMEAAGFEDVQFSGMSLWNSNSCLVGRKPAIA